MSELSPGHEFEERYFLLSDLVPPELRAKARLIRQAYASLDPIQVRCRVREGESYGVLEMKGPNDTESPPLRVPLEIAEQYMHAFRVPRSIVISKRRAVVPAGFDGLSLEMDFFLDDNAGLKIVEIEKPSRGHKVPRKRLPPYVGEKITGGRYEAMLKNKALALVPFSRFGRELRRKLLEKMRS